MSITEMSRCRERPELRGREVGEVRSRVSRSHCSHTGAALDPILVFVNSRENEIGLVGFHTQWAIARRHPYLDRIPPLPLEPLTHEEPDPFAFFGTLVNRRPTRIHHGDPRRLGGSRGLPLHFAVSLPNRAD